MQKHRKLPREFRNLPSFSPQKQSWDATHLDSFLKSSPGSVLFPALRLNRPQAKSHYRGSVPNSFIFERSQLGQGFAPSCDFNEICSQMQRLESQVLSPVEVLSGTAKQTRARASQAKHAFEKFQELKRLRLLTIKQERLHRALHRDPVCTKTRQHASISLEGEPRPRGVRLLSASWQDTHSDLFAPTMSEQKANSPFVTSPITGCFMHTRND